MRPDSACCRLTPRERMGKVINHGFVKTAAASPRLKVADPATNIVEIERLIKKADAAGTAVLVFPELCLTGYTCGDLFTQQQLLSGALRCLDRLRKNTRETAVAAVIGLPLAVGPKLYNCAVVIQHGQIRGAVPKQHLTNFREYGEERWFTPGPSTQETLEIDLLDQRVPFGSLLFYSLEWDFSFGVEIGRDLWSPIPPSTILARNGAVLIANPSASSALAGQFASRQQLVARQSARCGSGYIYASAGVHESTTDIVFDGVCMIAENGTILSTSQRFSRDSTIIYTDLDIQYLLTERRQRLSPGIAGSPPGGDTPVRTAALDYGQFDNRGHIPLDRVVTAYPFVPEDSSARDRQFEEIFQIQAAGLAKRLEHIGTDRTVLGVSGGLDSTLALLVTVKTYDLLQYPRRNILGVTLPGFGTSGQTHANALRLLESLGVTHQEVDIKPACRQHLQDIGHAPDVLDITFENAQARERTQVLMDIANQIHGLVVGTGDLSEMALGWSTYNGDHMSMYAVNAGIPKTLVRALVEWAAGNMPEEKTAAALKSILSTPISPELLPPDSSGAIKQRTEDAIGPYELHDFFLYHTIGRGAPPAKVLFLAETAFQGKYSRETIKHWLQVFYRRFFRQQFKRSCSPDGPKVVPISLSPRGGWLMPSDAEARLWLDELK